MKNLMTSNDKPVPYTPPISHLSLQNPSFYNQKSIPIVSGQREIATQKPHRPMGLCSIPAQNLQRPIGLCSIPAQNLQRLMSLCSIPAQNLQRPIGLCMFSASISHKFNNKSTVLLLNYELKSI